MSAVECFSLILVPGCVEPWLFSSNGVPPACLSRWFVFRTRVSIGLVITCWLCCRRSCSTLTIGSNWLVLSISKYQLRQTASWTSNGRLSWSRSVRMSASWVWGNDRRCLSTMHEEGLFLYNIVTKWERWTRRLIWNIDFELVLELCSIGFLDMLRGLMWDCMMPLL